MPRNACFEISSQIEELAQQLHHTYNGKPGKGLGGLSEDTEDSFSTHLSALYGGELSFHGFSVKTAELLRQKLMEFATLETGFVVFSRYQFLATDYLLIALINTRQHVEINQELELNYSDHLDLAKMQLAARIDITEMQVNKDKQRYISFIKGRAGRKVSDFFLSFLGCEELVDSKEQNKQLVSQVDQYLSGEQMDTSEKQQSRQVVSDYYKEKLEQGENISLPELSERMPASTEGQDFYSFIQQHQQEQPLEQDFPADRAVIKGLSKFSGQGGGISINFDRQLYGERIQYDQASDTLIIKGVPPNLKDQLLKSGK
ncbi:nucleoid-associated protein [Lacimicrobium alkaliphilum]|uniref:Nucleoid-associated protein n=2 Tax=Lacimicrobium alkaliphilum TaxID=1526571 RepID=A0ABQ1R273_9ALTE|nr:nucleoid-associated protein [Lacimicrobium alkaliphilum]